MKTITQNIKKLWIKSAAILVASAFLFVSAMAPFAAATAYSQRQNQSRNPTHSMLREKLVSIVSEPLPQKFQDKIEQISKETKGRQESKNTNIFLMYAHKVFFTIRKSAVVSVIFVRRLFKKKNNKDLNYLRAAALHEGEIDEEFEDVVKFAIKYAITTGRACFVHQPPQPQLIAGDIKIELFEWFKASTDKSYPFYIPEEYPIKPIKNPIAKLGLAIRHLPEALKSLIRDTNIVMVKLDENINYPLAWKLYKLVYKGDSDSRKEFLNLLNDEGSSIEAWNALYDLVIFLHAQAQKVNYVKDPYKKATKNAQERLIRIYQWVPKDGDIEYYIPEKDAVTLTLKSGEEIKIEDYFVEYIKKILLKKGQSLQNRTSKIKPKEQLQFLHYASKNLWQVARLGMQRKALYTTQETLVSMTELQTAEMLGHEGYHIRWINLSWPTIWKGVLGNPAAVVNFLRNGANTVELNNAGQDKILRNLARISTINLIRLLGYRKEDEEFWNKAKEGVIDPQEAHAMVDLLVKELNIDGLDEDKKEERKRKIYRLVQEASEESARMTERVVEDNYKNTNSIPEGEKNLGLNLREYLKSVGESLDSLKSTLGKETMQEDKVLERNDNSIGEGVEADLTKFILRYHIATGKAYYVWNESDPKDGDIIIPTAEDKIIVRDMEEVKRYINDALRYLENTSINEDNPLTEIKKRIKKSNVVVIKTKVDFVKDFRLAWKQEGYVKDSNEMEFITKLAGLEVNEQPRSMNGVLLHLYQEQLRANHHGSGELTVNFARESLLKIMLWLVSNRRIGAEFSRFTNIQMADLNRILEGYNLGRVFNRFTLENTDTPEKIRMFAPDFDSLNYTEWLKENMTLEAYENEKKIFYEDIFPRMVEDWREELAEKRRMEREGSLDERSLSQEERSKSDMKDSSQKVRKPLLIYYDFALGDPLWLAMRSSHSRPYTLYISEGLWEEVKNNPLALLQVLGVGVYGKEAEELIYNQFKNKMGSQSGEYETLTELLERFHPQTKRTKKVDHSWLEEGDISAGDDEAPKISDEALKRFRREHGLEDNDNSFYGERYAKNVWFPLIKNLNNLKQTNLAVWNSFITTLREVGFGNVAEQLTGAHSVGEFIQYAQPLQTSYEAVKAVVESAGFIVNSAIEYSSTMDEVKKKLGVDLDIEVVRGPPLPQMDVDQFVSHSTNSSGRLKIVIHEDQLKAHQDHLAEYLAAVISHEYLEYLGMNHEDVVEQGFGEGDLGKLYNLKLKGIAEKFKSTRAIYLTADRKYGHKDIAAELENWTVKEKEKTHTLLVPQFLLPSILPVAQRMREEGKRVEVVNLQGQGWGNIPTEELRNVKTIQTPFINGKFSLREIEAKIPDLFKDRNVMAVGQGLWADEDLMKELAISVMTIEFKIGSKMYEFVQDILKRSGMNGKDMKFLLERLSKPISLKSLENLALQDHEIKAVSVSQ